MTIEPIPEPISKLQQRFLFALEPTYTIEEIEAGRQQRPGEDARHIFDVEGEGVRLIISKDKLLDVSTIHISGSYSASGAARFKKTGGYDIAELQLNLERLFHEISQNRYELRFLGLTSNAVFHFVAKIRSSLVN